MSNYLRVHCNDTHAHDHCNDTHANEIDMNSITILILHSLEVKSVRQTIAKYIRKTFAFKLKSYKDF